MTKFANLKYGKNKGIQSVLGLPKAKTVVPECFFFFFPVTIDSLASNSIESIQQTRLLSLFNL